MTLLTAFGTNGLKWSVFAACNICFLKTINYRGTNVPFWHQWVKIAKNLTKKRAKICPSPTNLHFGQVQLLADVLDKDGRAGEHLQMVVDAAPAVPGQHREADGVEQDLLAGVKVNQISSSRSAVSLDCHALRPVSSVSRNQSPLSLENTAILILSYIINLKQSAQGHSTSPPKSKSRQKSFPLPANLFFPPSYFSPPSFLLPFLIPTSKMFLTH